MQRNIKFYIIISTSATEKENLSWTVNDILIHWSHSQSCLLKKIQKCQMLARFLSYLSSTQKGKPLQIFLIYDSLI